MNMFWNKKGGRMNSKDKRPKNNSSPMISLITDFLEVIVGLGIYLLFGVIKLAIDLITSFFRKK